MMWIIAQVRMQIVHRLHCVNVVIGWIKLLEPDCR